MVLGMEARGPLVHARHVFTAEPHSSSLTVNYSHLCGLISNKTTYPPLYTYILDKFFFFKL